MNMQACLQLKDVAKMTNAEKTELINQKSSDLDSEERQLVEKLRKLCGADCSEIDYNKTAPLLYELGKIFHKRSELISATLKQKNPDNIDILAKTEKQKMFSLIRSAALYNAAILRSAEDTKIIKQDLAELCSYILQQSGAVNKRADLIQQATNVKQQVTEMRIEAKKMLFKIPSANRESNNAVKSEQTKVSVIRDVQEQISDSYMKIMRNLAKYCLSVMGDAPCKFAVVGMGSLARKEITPYSDFEHVIVLEEKSKDSENYQQILNYFRWYSVIFQIVIINLKETIIPSVAIDSLSWFYDGITTRGISFDGMMPHASKFPLGRQETKNKFWNTELIKPVSKMLDYLSTKQSLKNGYNLSEILTKICYVFGDKAVYEEFEKGVLQSIQNQDEKEMHREVKLQTMKDLTNFGTKFSFFYEKPSTDFNMKKVIYRSTTIFIMALGRINKISVASCFDILEALKEGGIISNYAHDKLMYAVALACEVRLKWYMSKGRQTDLFDSAKHSLLEIMSNLVGESNALSYFQIAYALHCDISKRFNLQNIYFYANPHLLNTSMYHSVENGQSFSVLLQYHNNIFDLKKNQSFDECLIYLEKVIIDNQETHLNSQNAFGRKQQEILEMEKVHNLNHLCEMSFRFLLYDDALYFSQKSLAGLKKLKKKHIEFNKKNYFIVYDLIKTENMIAESIFCVGISFLLLGDVESAQKNFSEALEIAQETAPNRDNDILVAIVLCGIALCLFRQQKPAEAMPNFEKSRQVLSATRWNVELHAAFIQVLCSTADCLLALNETEKANELLEEALDVSKNDLKGTDFNNVTISVLYKLGCIKYQMKKQSEALVYYQEALDIYMKSSFDFEIDPGVALIFQKISDCFFLNENFRKSFEVLQKAKNIAVSISENKKTDKILAGILQELGMCKKLMNQVNDAVIYFKKALKIFLRIKSSETEEDISCTNFLLGSCLHEQSKFKEATPYLVKSLVMDKEMRLLITKNKEQKTGFKESCEIAEMIPVSELIALCKIGIEDSSFNGASCEQVLNMLGECLVFENQYDDALPYFKKSLEVQEKVPDDEKQNMYFAKTLINIGYCYDKKENYREALVYLKKAKSIYKNNTVKFLNNSNIVICINAIANCFKNLREFENAISYFKKVFQILGNVDVTPSAILNQLKLCICSLYLNNLTEAEIHLSKPFEVCKELSIFQNSTEDDKLFNNELENCIAEVQEWLRKHNQDKIHKNLFDKLFFFVDEFYKIKSKYVLH